MAITSKQEVQELAEKEVEVLEVEGLPKVHQLIRYISKQNLFAEEAWPVYAIDAYLESYINSGYKLFATHYLGENPAGFGVFYILVLDE